MATATKKPRRAKVSEEVEVDDSADGYDRAQHMLDLVGELDAAANVSAVAASEETRMHTGLLCMDLMTGGGVSPSMLTLIGPEQSAKTTLALTIQAASVDQNVDLRVHWDAEGSTSSSMDYVANIFETVGVKNASVETVYGVRGKEGWDVPPLVHLKDDYEGKKFFYWLHKLQKSLPDVRYEDGQWWYVYDDDKDVTKVKARLAKYGIEVHRGMSAKNSGLWVAGADSRLQALIIVDSWPSLVPPSMDEDDGDNSIALQARFFSKELPRVKGALRAKRIALVGINQLRINPMQRYGNPETEPGGQALKFWSDTRLRLFPNALSSAPYNPKPDEESKGKLEAEPNINGGRDLYRYISVGTIKNKLSIPNRSTWLRLWVEDANGNARGYDPVFDTFHYLMQTGQASGKRSAIKLHIRGLQPASKVLTWLEFKTLILGSKAQAKPIFDKIGLRPVNLRAGCRKQCRTGVAEELYVQTVQSRLLAKKSGEAVEE